MTLASSARPYGRSSSIGESPPVHTSHTSPEHRRCSQRGRILSHCVDYGRHYATPTLDRLAPCLRAFRDDCAPPRVPRAPRPQLRWPTTTRTDPGYLQMRPPSVSPTGPPLRPPASVQLRWIGAWSARLWPGALLCLQRGPHRSS